MSVAHRLRTTKRSILLSGLDNHLMLVLGGHTITIHARLLQIQA